ncbi:MAG: porin family protein [Nitrosomonas sp.]|nr:porin family protein [Nitrosomonas sp.]
MYHFCHKMRLITSAVAGLFAMSSLVVSSQTFAQGSAKTYALEQQIKVLESQLKAIRQELDHVKERTVHDEQEIRKVKEEVAREEQEVRAIKAKHEEIDRSMARRDRLLFFRGGYAHNLQGRNGSSLQSNVVPLGAQEAGDNDGWYVGAGFDWNLTRDVWGMLPKTSVFAELMFEYKKFGTAQGNALANAPSQLAGGTLNPLGITVTQFTVSAAPKIKFMEGSDFRPWIIPAGFAVHVVSPATESITYVFPGMMFAAGADYRIWKEFYVGVDARYHETFGKTDGINVSGLTAGAYLGIGF